MGRTTQLRHFFFLSWVILFYLFGFLGFSKVNILVGINADGSGPAFPGGLPAGPKYLVGNL